MPVITMTRPVKIAVAFIGVVALVILLVNAARWLLATDDVRSEYITIPLLAVVSLCAVIAFVCLLCILFSWLDLSDKTQALGLPDGTVRALIAIVLLVIFLVIPIYLFGTVSDGVRIKTELTSAEKLELVSRLPRSWLIEAVQDGAGTGAERKWTVYYRGGNPAQEDFAKTLYATISALATTVIGFYFGAGTAKSAHAAAVSPAPLLRTVDKSVLVAGQATDMTITGSNLELATGVMLSRGSQTISAASVFSNPTQITCNVATPQNAPLGKYDVVATMSDGKTARLAEAVEVKSAADGAA